MLERLFIVRYLLGHTKGSTVKTIAMISVGGIGIGVLAMVVVLSVMTGFDDAIKDRLLGVEPHIVVDNDDPNMRSAIEKVVGKEGDVTRFTRQDVILRTADGIFSGAIAQGEDMDLIHKSIKRLKRSVEVDDQGSVATARSEVLPIDFDLAPKEIIVGVDLARSLGIFDGDEVTLVAPESLLLPAGEIPIYEKATVRALAKTEVPDVDGHYIYFDGEKGLHRLRDTASIEKGFEIRLKDPDAAPKIGEKLKKANVGRVKTWRDMNAALFYSLKMEKTLMGVFLALTILVSCFSVVSVLVLLVTEKRADVGVLKAIGANRKLIRRIFMLIGLVLGLVGIVGGTIVGLSICGVLIRYPNLIKLPDIYVDTSFPVHVQPFMILMIIIIGILLTLAGTIVPAWRVSMHEPIAAIRHDDG